MKSLFSHLLQEKAWGKMVRRGEEWGDGNFYRGGKARELRRRYNRDRGRGLDKLRNSLLEKKGEDKKYLLE